MITIILCVQPPFSVSNGINISIISYNVTYISTISCEECGSAIIPASSCISGVCHHVFDVLSSFCPRLMGLSVTVYATNMLGDGKASNEFPVGFTNNFVNFVFNAKTRSISCSFMNKLDISEKFCGRVCAGCIQQ